MRPIKLKIYRKLATTLAAVLFFQALFPTIAWGLTSGPSQPEVQSFEPIGTSEMVDLFSGDFNYNIPLLEIGGYPINIAYHAGVGMEDEASWVGLGWNLNPGAINRNMRGIPDDYSGQDEEIVRKNVHIRDNFTASLTIRPSVEFFGFDALKLSGGVKYNNYRGVSLTGGASIGMDIVKMGGFALNMEMGANTEDGVYIKSGLSLDRMIYKRAGISAGINIGSQYNSRMGLQDLSFTRSFSKRHMIFTNSLPGGVKSGSLFSFNTPSYVTHAAHNTSNAAYSFDLKPGVEIPFTNTAGAFVGSMNIMKVDGERNMRAFGYLNSHKADHRTHLMDFNREKDGPYYFDSNVLPVTNFTYDSYSIVGQGVGGVYRPFRNQIGYVSDPVARSNEFGGASGGFEVGVPIFPVSWKTSASLGLNFINSYSGLWRSQNTAIGDNGYDFDNLPDDINSAQEALYEKSYFKKIGELTNDNGKYALLEGDEAISPNTAENSVDNQFIIPTQSGEEIDVIDYDIKDRTVRNQPLSALTAEETELAGLLKTIEDYTPGINVDLENKELIREVVDISDRCEALNIAPTQLYELTVTKPDGMRYIYGLPAYNLSQESTTFNVEGNEQNGEYKGAVKFTSSDVTDNSKGMDHFSSVEELPGYAYAHLLTAVISADYIDYTGDGPSDDDYGTWVKFNYSKIKPQQESNSDYFWRFPYSEGNVANLNEGFKSYTRDDKGSYVMGEKEIWAMHSLESKNHIAMFLTSDRKDGYGATEDGNKVTQFNKNRLVKQQKLDKIVHYAKSDLLEKGTDAIPLKTVHFDYSYSLCKGIANHEENTATSKNGGKLTLDNLYFTYGNSTKGKYSKYNFNYDGPNPDYDRRGQNRWGGFKAEPSISDNGYAPLNIANGDPLSNSDNPYVEQDKVLANEYASAWNMTSINLPSGGIIEIEYESDDYAYVQDKRAGQMHTLAGLSKSKDINDLINAVDENVLGNSNDQNNFLIVDIEDEIINNANDQNTDDENFRKLYLPENRLLYFRSLVDLKDGKHEFVPGYAKIIRSGVFEKFEDGGQQNMYGYIELKGVGLKDNEGNGRINPMVKAAINFARLNLPHLIWPERDPGNATFGFIQSLVTLVTKEPGRFIKGLNNSLLNEGFARSLVLDKSFVRLNNPNYAKKGGGCRVKKINMSDNWYTMTGSKDNNYGHQYFYQKRETRDDGSIKLVSSGVATYEPHLGNDENPLKQPIVIDVNRTLAPDNDHYIETPIGESLYPAASVGYSEVTVAATRPSAEIKRTATGYTKSKFYTVKDFPYEVKKNSGPAHRNKPGIISKLLDFRSVDEATANMGYSIILNDMHGKPKESWTYGGMLPTVAGNLQLSDDDPKNRISGSKYFYKTDENNNLDNDVKAIDEYGTLKDATVGVESEMVLDYRENSTDSYRVNISINIDSWLIPWFPFPVITTVIPIPGFSSSKTQFRSAVATKLVNKHGLLDKIEAHRNGSVITTKNEVYDAVTGDVLLTSVNNEFNSNDDDNSTLDNLIYNMSYPAHWAYTGMEQSAKNLGAEVYLRLGSLISPGPSDGKAEICNAVGQVIQNINEDDVFHVGDELLFDVKLNVAEIQISEENRKLWVASVTTNEVILIDHEGEYFDFSVVVNGNQLDPFLKVKIVRSGHRNQQSSPIASLTTMKNPVSTIFVDGLSGDNTENYFRDQAKKLRVLDFSAQEFDDNWQTYCREGEYTVVTSECVYTPKIFHPVTGEENKFLTQINNEFINDDGEIKTVIEASFNIELDSEDGNCESDEGVKVIEILDPGRMEIEHYYGQNASMQGFYFHELQLFGTFQPNPINIPLSNIIFDGSNFSLFETQIEEEINQFLSNNYPNAESNIKANFFEVSENNYRFDFYHEAIHSAINDWIGLKRGKSHYKFVSPVFPQNIISSGKARHDYKSEGGNTYSNEFNCGTVNVWTDIIKNFIDSEQSDFNYIKLAFDGFAGPNVPFGTVNINPDILECIETVQVQCFEENEYVNPFQEGLKGNWRPSKSWVHQSVPRKQSVVFVDVSPTAQYTPIPEAERNGFYRYFDQFWNKPSGDEKWSKDIKHYTLVNEVTKYNPYGEAIESRDALGIYSSAILGYDNKLAIAVGNNTEYRQFAFDGFEEYQFPLNVDQCYTKMHMDLGVTKEDVSDEESHTGIYSLKVAKNIGNSFIISCEDRNPIPSEAHQFQINDCYHCIPTFDPGWNTYNVSYVVDLWVKGDGQFIINQYDDGGNLIANAFTPEGPEIEGWQRIYETVELDRNTTKLEMNFVNLDQSGKPCYIDDFRIYPFDANMKSFVYDPSSLKLMAELDENNHATFYEYDEEWNLIRVKKETERGVYTLQENQNNIRRSD